MATYSNSAREVEMPNGDVVVLHSAPTGGANTTSNIKKFKYDGNGHVTESEAANATDLNLNSYSTPTTGSTAIGTSDAVQTAIGKLDHQSQIDQSNILYAINTGVKNILPVNVNALKAINLNGSWTENSYLYNGVRYTVNSDGSITITRTSSSSSDSTFNLEMSVGNKYVGYYLSGGSDYCAIIMLTTGGNTALAVRTTANVVPSNATGNMNLFVRSSDSPDNHTVYPMISYMNDSDYQPYALPNYDLTYLQAEDRASLAEVVDSGAKNLLDFASVALTQQHPDSGGNVPVYTKTNTSFTISGTVAWVRCVYGPIRLKAGTYVLYTNITAASISSHFAVVRLSENADNTGQITRVEFTTTGKYSSEFTISQERNVYISFCPNYNDAAIPTANSFTATDLMICTKAAFGVSNKFVPFGNDPFYQVPINHNMIYRGRNLGATLTDAQHTALSSGNFTDLYLGDYWTKTVTIPAGTYTGGDGEEVTVPAQTNITLKAVIADFDTFYAGYASSYAGINTHHAAVIVTGFSNVVWNKTNSTAGGYVASLIHKWLVGSALPQIETWFGSAKVLSHQKLLTNAITGDAASGWAWSSQKISLLSENQMYGSKVWGNSKAANGGYEPGEAFKHLNVFNHIDANLLFGNINIWLRDIVSAEWTAGLDRRGDAFNCDASNSGITPAALILLS